MDQSFFILKDLYALASIFYIKGIADANTVCDPYLVEDMIGREDNYTTLQIIVEDEIWQQEPDDYTLNLTQAASAHNLHHIRNFILHTASDVMKRALCCLMDYLYRQGLKRHVMYDGHQPEKMLREISPNSTYYLTPKGTMTQAAWHDLLRQYIMQIKLIHAKAEKPSIMQNLNEFMAVVLKNKTELNEAEFLENERRLFILTGGSVPTKRGQNI